MVGNGMAAVRRSLIVCGLVAVGASAGLRADDTEIYKASYSPGGTGGRPNVLIIFDDSGSMDSNVVSQPPAYDPTATYTVPTSSATTAQVYWTVSDPDEEALPPPYDTTQYFPVANNRCAESYTPLKSVGVFTSKALRWQSGATTWTPLDSADQNPLYVDCLVDVVNANSSNGTGQPNGYPKIPTGAYNADEEYSATTPEDSDLEWGNAKVYTFYSAHYMGYLEYIKNPAVLVTRTRMDIAKEAVRTIIASNPGIDFGFAVFNANTPSWSWNGSYWEGSELQNLSGGRVVNRILESDDASARTSHRTSLITTIGGSRSGLTSNGWTPLCETTYEAYRYLAGEAVYYGDKRDATVDTPDRDTAAENPANTYAPPIPDCAVTYVILMTDGLPTFDTHANTAIEALTGEICDSYLDDYTADGAESKNCLPSLAKYMATQDLDQDDSNGEQLAVLSTIGFTTDQVLLEDTARNGGGKYFIANNATGLASALQGAVSIALDTDVTFTSPSVAVDSFTRTQSRDNVYFSMFNPERRVDWRGNIKRLKLKVDIEIVDSQSITVAKLVDRTGADAINSSTGAIDSGASTYWSTADGGSVEKGGVGALLVSRVNPRKIVINTATANASGLEDFNSTNIDAEGFGFTDAAELFDKFDVSDQAELNQVISWGTGVDAFDEDQDGNVTETRQWILADMLHSKPLVVNYGATDSSNEEDGADLRIVVGTNGGFFHMFNNKTGDENWAFFPKELAEVLKQRAENAVSDDNVYGIDGSSVLYSKDLNFDGTIDAADGDLAWVYFGLRRGGRALYALDISDPDSPKFKWKIDQATAGFGELGQTWSDPVVTRIPGYADVNGVPKPVLVFGAGYDELKDGPGLVTDTVDSMGRGIYIVDAATGALVWSVTPRAYGETPAKNLQETRLIHSVAAGLTTLDSNVDGLIDRIYFADTGGNIWRVDMPGNTLPTTSQDTWRIVQLAAMNGGTAATDRRFFNAPDIVRTRSAGVNFDAVLIGSGDRTNPNSTDVLDQFYMIKDKQINPYFTPAPAVGTCPVNPYDFRCDLPLNSTDPAPADPNEPNPEPFLYDVKAGDAMEKETSLKLLNSSDGWRLDLEAAPGEKSLSRSLTIAGKTYFGTFTPATDLNQVCEPLHGTGRLYVINLLSAAGVRDFDPDEDNERFGTIGSLIPDTPSVHVGQDGIIRLLLPPGSSGGGDMSNPFLTGESLRKPYGTYWYQEDY